MNDYYINCKKDTFFYYDMISINCRKLPIKYFADHFYGKYDSYVNTKYIDFINFLGNQIVIKIQKWWLRKYYSPYTKIGKKRLSKSYNNLSKNDIIVDNYKNKIENKDLKLNFTDKNQYNNFNKKYIYSFNENILFYFLKNFKGI